MIRSLDGLIEDASGGNFMISCNFGRDSGNFYVNCTRKPKKPSLLELQGTNLHS